MHLIDTHTHLDFPEFDADRAAVLARSRALGVREMVVLGVHRDNWQRLWDLVETDPQLYAAFGLHPIYLAQHSADDLAALQSWLERLHGHPQLCAVGEIGLDYYLEHLDHEAQQALFVSQLQMAQALALPVLVHVRRAHAATIALLKQHRPARGGIIHAFAGSYEEAREYLKLGFKLGLGGAPTWPQANRLRNVLTRLPLDAIVLETDAPDMPPAMHPKQRNSPEHLPAICSALAELLNLTPQTLAQASSRNACELFGWPHQ